MTSRVEPTVPLLAEKHYDAPSAFTAENLLREARRQKSLKPLNVPRVCVLDPDGDLVRQLKVPAPPGPTANARKTIHDFGEGEQARNAAGSLWTGTCGRNLNGVKPVEAPAYHDAFLGQFLGRGVGAGFLRA